MQDLIAALDGKARIIIVTAFWPTVCLDKYNWQQQHYPQIDGRNIIFCNQKDCINADVIVDDGLHNLEWFKGIPICMDYPWNRGATHNAYGKPIIRVKDGYELLPLLQDFITSWHAAAALL